jgi:hypothetical protein
VKNLFACATALLLAVTLAGCGDANPTKGTTQIKNPPTFHVCHHCGEIQVDDDEKHVCKAGERCKKCTKIEGSAGCCKDGHTVVCQQCGEAYDSETVKPHTCKITDACPDCKRQKGSPGCCCEKHAQQLAEKDKTPKAAS